MTRYREPAELQHRGNVVPMVDAATRPGLLDDHDEQDLAAAMERHPAAAQWAADPPALLITIPGQPRAQGSVKMITARYAKYSDPVVAQRNLIVGRLHTEWAGRPPITHAVEVNVTAGYQRPAVHYGTGRNSSRVKDTAPMYPVGRNLGDADKIGRLILDALTVAGVIGDDCLVVDVHVRKCWAAHPCTIIGVRILP